MGWSRRQFKGIAFGSGRDSSAIAREGARHGAGSASGRWRTRRPGLGLSGTCGPR